MAQPTNIDKVPDKVPPLPGTTTIAKQKPSLGRIVHYTRKTNKSVCAAIVTKVNPDGSLELNIFVPGGHSIQAGAILEGNEPGCWKWPPIIIPQPQPTPAVLPQQPGEIPTPKPEVKNS